MTEQPCCGAPWITHFMDEVILPDHRIFALVLAILFLLDCITTELVLIGGGMELNPVMVGIVASPALHLAVKGAVFLFILGATGYAGRQVQSSGVVALSAIIIWYGMVVGNNLGILIGMQ